MKKAILLFAIIFSMGAVAFAQSADDAQQSTTPISQQDKQQMEEQLGNFYTMLNATSSQQQELDNIAEKYYGFYVENKANYTTKEDLKEYRSFLINKALKEAKPILTNDQWNSVSELVRDRKEKLEHD